jgi:sulfatase maturation enzyme AslB (radical SAM superfamily)
MIDSLLLNKETGPDIRFDLVVVVRVNTSCQLGCVYCGYSRDLRLTPVTIDGETLRALGQSLAEYQVAHNHRVLVSWIGGEPFQWDSWHRWSQRFVDTYGVAVSLTTNGLALGNHETRAKALDCFTEITISLDGFADDHDRMRKSPGLFERLRNIIQSIVNERALNKPRLRINSVLTRENMGRFADFCDHVSRWGVDELTFNQLGGNDRPEYYADHSLRPEEVSALVASMPSIQHRALANGMRVCSSDEYLRRIMATAERRSLPILDCSPASRFLFVDEHGNLGPCSFTAHRLGVQIKGLDETDISELPSLFSQRLREDRPVSCLDCHATHMFQKFN